MPNMRTVFSVLLSLCVSLLAAQSLKPLAAAVHNFELLNGQFYDVNLFEKSPQSSILLKKSVRDAQGLQLNFKKLAPTLKANPQGVILSLPYNNEVIKLQLVRAQVVSDDYTVITSESNDQPVPVKQGLHYRGIVEGHPESLAAISLFDNSVMGLVADKEHGNMVLGALDVPGNTVEYILYEDRKIPEPFNFTCGTEDRDDLTVPGHGQGLPESLVSGCPRVFIEADNELYVNKGSVQNTVNYLTGVFNQVATLYANETISTVMSGNFVWTTADSYSNTSSSTALNTFRTTRTSFTGDLAHLASLGGQNIGGVAYLDVICNSGYRYAYSNIFASYSNVPTYSWTVMVMTHEMGHNLGSNHTQWCGWTGGALDNCYTTEGGCAAGPAPTNGGTIMSYCHLTSYGINLSNGFGSQPGNKIRTQVSAATCLAATCSGGGGGTTCTDQYEPNNSRTTAPVIPVNTTFTAGIVSSTDLDWYRFANTSTARRIKVELTNLPADYDLKLYRSSTQVAVSENAGTANETIIYNTTTVSTSYYAYVYGYNGANSASQCYSLRVSLSATNWLTGDDSEERGEYTFEVPVMFEDAGFGLYPNPAADNVVVEVPADETSPVSVSICDVAGKVIRLEKRAASSSDYLLNFDLAQMNNGVYFVTVQQGDRTNTRKLVVNH